MFPGEKIIQEKFLETLEQRIIGPCESLPRIQDSLKELGEDKDLTNLDLKSG